jgi:hypothetical protein
MRKGLAFGGIVTLATAAWLQFPSLFLSVETWARAGAQLALHRVWQGDMELAFRDVRSELDARTSGAVLIVTGEIANVAAHEAILPHLEFLVRNGDEQVLATWTSAPPRPKLGPGEAVRFETRLASPPPQGRQVRVHFTAAGGIAMASRSPH